MKRSRFSIAGLMGLVMVIALGLVGLKQANPVWASTFFTFMLVALVISVVNAIQSRERVRAFWTGFAISGWVYFLCVFGTGSTSGVATPGLLTGLLLDRTLPLLHPDPVYSVTFTQPPMPNPVVGSTSAPPVALPPLPVTPAPAPPQPVIQTVTISGPAVPFTSWLPWNLANDTVTGPYRQIGHSMGALLVAYLGGLYSIFAASRRDRQRDESDPTVSPSSP